MYGEEADLCIRAHEIGAKPMVTSGATIIHYGGASEKIRSDKIIRLMKAKAQLIFFHFPGYSKNFALCLLYLWPWSRMCAHSILFKLGFKEASDSAEVWREVVHRSELWFIRDV